MFLWKVTNNDSVQLKMLVWGHLCFAGFLWCAAVFTRLFSFTCNRCFSSSACSLSLECVFYSEMQLPVIGRNSHLPGKPTETQAPGSVKHPSFHPLPPRPLCLKTWSEMDSRKPEANREKSQIPVADGSPYSFHLFSLHARGGYIINWEGDHTSLLWKTPAWHCGIHPREVSLFFFPPEV